MLPLSQGISITQGGACLGRVDSAHLVAVDNGIPRRVLPVIVDNELVLHVHVVMRECPLVMR